MKPKLKRAIGISFALLGVIFMFEVAMTLNWLLALYSVVFFLMGVPMYMFARKEIKEEQNELHQ